MAAQVPNIFVEQYDQGQKKIRADLMDENFAYVCDQIDTQAGSAQSAAESAQAAADSKTTAAEAAAAAMPDFSRAVSVSMPISNSGTTYTPPSAGWLRVEWNPTSGNAGKAYMYLRNGTTYYYADVDGGYTKAFVVPVTTDMQLTLQYPANYVTGLSCTFYPCKGA